MTGRRSGFGRRFTATASGSGFIGGDFHSEPSSGGSRAGLVSLLLRRLLLRRLQHDPPPQTIKVCWLGDSHGYQPALPAAPEERMRQVSASSSPADRRDADPSDARQCRAASMSVCEKERLARTGRLENSTAKRSLRIAVCTSQLGGRRTYRGGAGNSRNRPDTGHSALRGSPSSPPEADLLFLPNVRPPSTRSGSQSSVRYGGNAPVAVILVREGHPLRERARLGWGAAGARQRGPIRCGRRLRCLLMTEVDCAAPLFGYVFQPSLDHSTTASSATRRA